MMKKEPFLKRARIIDLIRDWFRREGFLEVETPIMVKYPGMEPDLDVFSTEFVSKDGKWREKRYLHTSPEYAMKKLLGAGFQKIFQMCKVFRNGEFLVQGSEFRGEREGLMTRHNPEFTMLEWYRTAADYQTMMEDTEKMVKWISSKFQVPSSEFREKWGRLSVREAFLKYAKMDLDQLRTLELLRAAVEKKGYELRTKFSWDDLFFLVLLNEIEPKLGFDPSAPPRARRPVFLYDYPASQAALAKKKADDSFWAERFELYINGVELCNGFSELNDPVEQRQRLEEEQRMRKKIGKEVFPLDEEFLEALKTMPRSGGNALGIDRLVMVLLGKKSIGDVMLFPW